MLGLQVKLSLGARRHRLADSGLTSTGLLLAALLLSACQPQHQLKLAGADTAEPAEVEVPQSSKPIEPQYGGPDPLPKQTPLAATPAVAHGDTILPAAMHLSGDPEELLGLDHSALRRVLGAPAQLRHEFTIQVWQYVTGDCVVDLYLYDQDGGLKVTYVEARSRSAEQTPTNRCLKSLLERPTASAQ